MGTAQPGEQLLCPLAQEWPVAVQSQARVCLMTHPDVTRLAGSEPRVCECPEAACLPSLASRGAQHGTAGCPEKPPESKDV